MSQSANRRIAKNSLFMSIRMVIVLAITKGFFTNGRIKADATAHIKVASIFNMLIM